MACDNVRHISMGIMHNIVVEMAFYFTVIVKHSTSYADGNYANYED